MKTIARLQNAVNRFVGYDESAKSEFASASRAFLRELKKSLGVDAEVRYYAGGVAVSGEATLHGDNLYCQVEGGTGQSLGILVRGCKGRKDYSGTQNRWVRLADLAREADGGFPTFKAAMQDATR